MAKQTINIGAAANDGTGDPIRTAFGKVNDNFTEIYTANTGVNTGDQNLAAYATTAAVAAGYQPLDSDLTAIAALTTTAYGRALLSTADAPTLRTAIGLGQTDAPTFLAQSLTGQSLTGTQATNLLDLATTWDTTGTPTAIKVNATNTNSNPATKFIDLQLSTVSKFRVGKGGNIFSGANAVTADGGTGVAGVSLEMLFANYGIGVDGNGNCQFLLNGTARSRVGFGVCIGNNQTFSFSDLQHTGLNSVPDVLLARDAPGILAQRNGTAKQAFRVYNTFLGTTANEWGGFDWLTTTNTLRIGTEHGGTGTARPIDFVTGGVRRGGFHGTNGNFDVAVNLVVSQNIYAGVGSAAAPSYTFGTRADTGLFSETATEIGISIGGTRHLRLQTGICVINSGNIGVGGGFDANLSRIAGSSLAIGNGTLGDFSGSLKLRNVIQSPGVGTIVTPASNGDLVFETTSNTSVTVKLKGSDGTVRSFALTLV
jgi:hypothetical protein